MTFCTPFRSRIGPIRVMAETFSGLGLMPRWETMKPKSMPRGIPNTHFSGVEFHPLSPKAIERDPEIGYQIVRLPGFHNDVIDIRLYSPPDMVFKHVKHTSLVCSSGVSKAKGHHDVAVHAEKGNKRSHELVGLFHFDLMITGVCIKKGKGILGHALFKLV